MEYLGVNRKVNLKGHFLPWYIDTDQPVLVSLEDKFFVVVFSSIEKLEEQLPIIKPKGRTKIKVIQDSMYFVKSVISDTNGMIRIMLDPFVYMGKTRFTEVVPDVG